MIYLQDILGYSELGAGLRVSIITLATLVTATAAGRLKPTVLWAMIVLMAQRLATPINHTCTRSSHRPCAARYHHG